MAALALLGVSACGDSASSSDDAPLCGGGTAYDAGIPDMPQVAPMDEATFLAEYVKTYCDAMEGCCQSAQVAFGRSGCEASAQATASGLKGYGSSQFDPDAGARCIAGLWWFGLVCPTTGPIAVLGPGITCGGVYHGTLPAGTSCSSRTQCEAPSGGDALCMPVCYPGPDVCITFVADRGLGEPCTRLSDEGVTTYHDCTDGYECSESTGLCEAARESGLGADCSSQGCGTGMRCDDTDHCAALLGAGAACTGSLQCWASCENGVCTSGLDAESCYSP